MFRSMMLGVIRFYRKGISPFTPPSCRYTPTCSAYAQEAIERHGSLWGGWLAFRRVMRCHPWGGWGFDPVPTKTTDRLPGGPEHTPAPPS